MFVFKKAAEAGSVFMGLLFASLASTGLHANIVNMSTHVYYADLQVAIDAADEGDTLMVNGTQVGNFVINKDLTLKGGKHAVLDGNQADTVLTIGTLGNVVVYLDDLTIQNGFATNGGGIFNEATLTLSKVTLTQNSALETGGGVYSSSALIVKHSEISSNSAGSFGGGIYNDEGALLIDRTKIRSNTSYDDGGGVYCYFGVAPVTISDTEIERNASLNGNGGGIVVYSTEITFDDVKIKRNKAIWGGGIYNTGNSILQINDSELERNEASDLGGGIFNASGSVSLFKSDVRHNKASVDGGGIFNVNDNTLDIEKTKLKHNNPNNIAQGSIV
jgi:nitrous oxidase accessory protein NosD